MILLQIIKPICLFLIDPHSKCNGCHRSLLNSLDFPIASQSFQLTSQLVSYFYNCRVHLQLVQYQLLDNVQIPSYILQLDIVQSLLSEQILKYKPLPSQLAYMDSQLATWLEKNKCSQLASYIIIQYCPNIYICMTKTALKMSCDP